MGSKHLLDLSNSPSGVQALGASPRAVEDGVATVDAHAVIESVLTLGGLLVTRIGQPTVRLKQDGRTQVLLAVPPVRRARGRAAGAQDAFVKTVELLAVLGALAVLKTILGLGVTLQVRLDGLVLLVEVGQIGDQVLDDIGVRQRVDTRLLLGVGGNTAQASQSVDSINVHGAATADTLSATSPESQGGVDLVLDSDERIQHHRAGLVQIQAVGLHLGLLGGLVGVPAIDMELLDSRSLGRAGILNIGSPGLGGNLGLRTASATDTSSGINSGIRASKDGRTEQRPCGCDEARGRTKSGHSGRTRGRSFQSR